MSATNRGTVRNEADFYETPSWCVRRLLERLWLPGGSWFEPAAGHGAIIRAVNAVHEEKVEWCACELRPEAWARLREVVDGPDLFVGIDFLNGDFAGTDFAVVATNPPYSLAMEFVENALPLAPYVVMLLRLNFLGSAKRSAFFRGEMPDVYVLPNRPSFTGGGTDATEYAWFVWTPERERRAGRQEVLDKTPAHERKATRQPTCANPVHTTECCL